MRLSEYIEKLKKTLRATGDCHLLRAVIETEEEIQEWKMISKTRKDKNGMSLKMTPKEFREYIKDKQERES